jgi:phosphotransferase system HPr-like phosphotransfer protein
MKEMSVMLGNIEKAKHFVNIVSDYDEDLDLVRGRYCIDAKSIMGILSMDLKYPVTLRVNTSDGQRFQEIRKDLKSYTVV